MSNNSRAITTGSVNIAINSNNVHAIFITHERDHVSLVTQANRFLPSKYVQNKESTHAI